MFDFFKFLVVNPITDSLNSKEYVKSRINTPDIIMYKFRYFFKKPCHHLRIFFSLFLNMRTNDSKMHKIGSFFYSTITWLPKYKILNQIYLLLIIQLHTWIFIVLYLSYPPFYLSHIHNFTKFYFIRKVGFHSPFSHSFLGLICFFICIRWNKYCT